MIGDDELNFTEEEARAMGHVPVAATLHFPVAPTRNLPPRQHRVDNRDLGVILFGIVGALIAVAVVATFVCSGSHSNSSPQSVQSSATHKQSSSSNQEIPLSAQQSSPPEYFPAGWDYVTNANPAQVRKGSEIYILPKDSKFFVSLRNSYGFHLAVATDGGWNGWVDLTGFERQIPMHPDFVGAKGFIESLGPNFLESSYSSEAPSQEAAKTDLEALRASEVQTERSDMTLFQKKDKNKEQPADITVQGEEAIIPLPPESEQEEKKVKLPKTKWYGEVGASAPFFSDWRWVCRSRGGFLCVLQDVNGQYVQTFFWNGGSVQASAISTAAIFPQSLVWNCAKMPGILYCSMLDNRGTNRQGCAYDGKSLACGN